MPAECQSLAQCLGSNQIYNLWVNTPNHSINNPVVIRSSEEGPQLLIQSPSAETQAVLRVRIGDGKSTLLVHQPPHSPTSASTALKLQGPSGRGIYELGAAEDLEPYGVGSEIEYRGWCIEKIGDGQMALVYGDDWTGFEWIAVPKMGADGETNEWALWWREPCSANDGCFEGEVIVNLSIRPEQNDGKVEL